MKNPFLRKLIRILLISGVVTLIVVLFDMTNGIGFINFKNPDELVKILYPFFVIVFLLASFSFLRERHVLKNLLKLRRKLLDKLNIIQNPYLRESTEVFLTIMSIVIILGPIAWYLMLYDIEFAFVILGILAIIFFPGLIFLSVLGLNSGGFFAGVVFYIIYPIVLSLILTGLRNMLRDSTENFKFITFLILFALFAVYLWFLYMGISSLSS